MAAFVSAILSTLGSVGAAAGAAGGTAAAAAGGASTAFSILQGGATALSVLMGIGAASEEATGLELAAGDAVSEAADEGVLGLERRNSLRRDMLQAVGERDVAYAASGVDVSFGTPVEARAKATRDAERALSIDYQTEQSRFARLIQRAELLRIRARQVRRTGLLGSMTKGLSGAADIFARG